MGKLGLKFPTWENISLPVDKAGKIILRKYGELWEILGKYWFPKRVCLGKFWVRISHLGKYFTVCGQSGKIYRLKIWEIMRKFGKINIMVFLDFPAVGKIIPFRDKIFPMCGKKFHCVWTNVFGRYLGKNGKN